MHEYQAPLADMKFVLRELVDLESLSQLPGFGDLTLDVAEAVLGEGEKFAAGVLSPLNRSGDLQGARWQEGEVLTAEGWKQAYARFVADGWAALSCPAQFGGQNLPRVLSALVEEMWNGANMAFALCPMLTRGTVDAIELRGSQALQDTYLAKLVSGRMDRHHESHGTAGRLRPGGRAHAGRSHRRWPLPADGPEDLHHLRRARPDRQHRAPGAGTHRRSAGGRQGHFAVRGAEVPGQCRRLSRARATTFTARPSSTSSGSTAAPPASWPSGRTAAPSGELVGEENRGLEYMFIMMNAARYSVGIEGVGLSERAYQAALAYARERIQSTEAGRARRRPRAHHPASRCAPHADCS